MADPPAGVTHMLINRRLGDYVLLKKIATGGMAEIFLARRRKARLPKGLVAMKAIMSGRTDDEDFQRMFSNEATLAAYFDHPQVVKLEELVNFGGLECMVLEFVHGHTLEELLHAAYKQGEKLPLEAAIWLVMKACEGLDHIHNLTDETGTPLSIVHRDISPQNILLSYDAQVKIFDFGIADSAITSDNVREGAMAGKYAYMSPEQCRGERLDARSDLFSIAIVLWELTTGERLFKRENQIQAINAIIEEPIPRPSEHCEGYPEALEPIVMAALSKNRDERTRSCLALRMALNGFLSQAGLQPHRQQISDLMRGLFAEDLDTFYNLIDEARRAPEPGEPLSKSKRIDTESEAEIEAAVEKAIKAERAREEAKAAAALDSFLSEPSNPSAPSPMIPLESGPHAPPLTDPRVMMQAPNTPAPVTVTVAYPQTQREAGLPRVFLIVAAVALGLAMMVVAALAYIMFIDSPVVAPPPQTLSKPTSGTLSIVTKPEGAQITLSGRKLSVLTPTEVPGLDFGKPQIITLEKPGHEPAQFKVVFSPEKPTHAIKVSLVEDSTKATGMGGLRVLTTPTDARIFLNNKKIADSTPVTWHKVPAGEQQALRISRDGYQDEILAFTVTKGEIKDFEIELSARDEVEALAQLTLTSEPSRCRVTVNDDFYGNTEMTGLLMPADIPLDIEVTCKGMAPWSRRVLLKPDEDRRIHAALGLAAIVDKTPPEEEIKVESPLAVVEEDDGMVVLTLTTDPPTRISANGQPIGEAPLQGIKLKPGRYLLTFTNEASNLRYSKRVIFKKGAEENMAIKIPTGTIKVDADLDAEVYVNGTLVGSTPLAQHTLYAGIHKIRVVAPSLGYSREYRIRVRGEDKKAINTRFKEVRVTRLKETRPEEDNKGIEAGDGEKDPASDDPGAENQGDNKNDGESPGEDDKGEPVEKKDPAAEKADKGANKKADKGTTKKNPTKKPPKKNNPLDDEPYPLLK